MMRYSEDKMKNKVAYFGVLVALSLILSYVETLLPVNFGIPGVKLGLTNLVIVTALYSLSFKETLLLTVVRVLLVGFLFGSLAGILYSLGGAVLSLVTMYLLKRFAGNSLVVVSVAGGVMHNIGQLLVAMVMVSTLHIAYYVPVLIVAGALTGLAIGLAARELVRRLGVLNLYDFDKGKRR